jgi:hypothetical protein
MMRRFMVSGPPDLPWALFEPFWRECPLDLGIDVVNDNRTVGPTMRL